MVAGTIIGASIFVQPSEIARHLETPLQIMFVWAACGVLPRSLPAADRVQRR
jgi:ABC-type Mn2+/Zn2+ transport system permease subunit